MEIELFKKSYTPTMMRLIKILSENLYSEIIKDLASESHIVILETKEKINDLAQARMLLSAYEGCPFCFEIDCQSDHK